jgi:hypothetical protein
MTAFSVLSSPDSLPAIVRSHVGPCRIIHSVDNSTIRCVGGVSCCDNLVFTVHFRLHAEELQASVEVEHTFLSVNY